MNDIKLMAFDLDGTLTQHKTQLGEHNKLLLDALGKKYSLIMVGAGQCSRIFKQMNGYPIDIIGNYGMQFCTFEEKSGELKVVFDEQRPCDRECVERRVSELRRKYGYTEFKGDNVEYHSSGCVTFPLLGTAADIADKLAFDPDKKKRSLIYTDVRETFSDYVVFIGGSSSFDFAPKPYDKYFALERYCSQKGLSHDQVLYIGDDYGIGGNDEAVYRSDIPFLCVDDYTRLPEYMKPYLE